MSTDNTTVDTTKKVASKVAEKVADTNIAPAVVETAEVAVTVPSKFVLSGRGAAIAVVGAVALGAGGLFGVQKLLAIRAAKKAAKTTPDTVEAAPSVKVAKKPGASEN